MSSLVISGDVSGSVTFQAPSAAGSTTLTLPAVSGTILQSGTTVTEAQGGTGTTVGHNAFKNRIINGAMMIDQRNAGAAITVSTDPFPRNFAVDRFFESASGGGVYSAQRATTAPAGFTNSLALTVTTADASIAAGDVYYFAHAVEAYNTTDFNFGSANAATVTLSFWVRSSITGTFSGSLRNHAGNRSYCFTYTINSANTWEQKSITIAGDTTGTWEGATNNGGVWVAWDLGSGTTFNGTVNTWQAGNLLRTSSATNWIATLGATFYITGVQLEKGSTATSFDYRPYGTELLLCQRYYEQTAQGYDLIWTGYCSSGSIYYITTTYKVSKRAAPTITTSSAGTNSFNAASLSSADVSAETCNLNCTSNATAVRGYFYASFKASAEL